MFAPGLTDDVLIAELCRRSSRPVNVMMGGPLTSVRQVADPGVARASFGPAPYRWAQDDLAGRFARLAQDA